MRVASTKLLACCLAAATFGLPCFSQDATQSNKRLPASLETKGEKKLDVGYKEVRGKKLSLDLYYPAEKRDSKCPLIVYTHGGGWAAGSRHGVSKGLFKPLFEKLIAKGFCVATVDYRLTKKGSGVVMRDCVIDCKDAVRYLASNGESLGLDPTRFFVMGDSAGGQIAQMLLLSAPESLPGDPSLADANYNIVAGVSWYGPCDFEKVDLFQTSDSSKNPDRFGNRILDPDADPKDKLSRYREMSPINYLSKDSSPLLMIQGDKDTTIPVKHAWYMQERAEELGAPVEVMIIQNAGHNWRKVGAEIDPSFDVIVDRSVQFFVEQLSKVSSK